MRIRGETIKFASHLKKKRDLQGKKIIEDITHLEQRGLDRTNNIQLDEKRVPLENIRKEKVNGILTRSRIQCLNVGEKPSFFFAIGK